MFCRTIRACVALFVVPLVAGGKEQQIRIDAIVAEVEMGGKNRYAIDRLRAIERIEIRGEEIGIGGCFQPEHPPVRISPGKVGMSGGEKSMAFFRACADELASAEGVTVISRSMVYTSDGGDAAIAVGSRVAVPAGDSAESVPGADVAFREIGIRLRVSPAVDEKAGVVRLDIDFENSTLDETGEVTSQSLAGKARLADGEIIALGGAVIERSEKRRILGRIPGVRQIAGSRDRRIEVVVLLQAHQVDGLSQQLLQPPNEGIHDVSREDQNAAQPRRRLSVVGRDRWSRRR